MGRDMYVLQVAAAEDMPVASDRAANTHSYSAAAVSELDHGDVRVYSELVAHAAVGLGAGAPRARGAWYGHAGGGRGPGIEVSRA